MTKEKNNQTEKEKSILEFNEKKASELLEKLLDDFSDAKLGVGEILIVVSNLLYALGASIEGYKDKGPRLSELEKIYYENPSVGNALMAQGALMATWYEDWAKLQTEKDSSD